MPHSALPTICLWLNHDSGDTTNHLPIVVGGTGSFMFFFALSNVQLAPYKQDRRCGNSFCNTLRSMKRCPTATKLKHWIHGAAAGIPSNNLVSGGEGAEVCTLTGKHLPAAKRRGNRDPSPCRSLVIRAADLCKHSVLTTRINERVDQIVAQGLVMEAYAVYQNEALRTAYHAIGYKSDPIF